MMKNFKYLIYFNYQQVDFVIINLHDVQIYFNLLLQFNLFYH